MSSAQVFGVTGLPSSDSRLLKEALENYSLAVSREVEEKLQAALTSKRQVMQAIRELLKILVQLWDR